MAIGPGKYDDICSRVRADTGADAAIVIILGGKKGSGFSVTTYEHSGEFMMTALPQLLENMAAQIRADLTPKGSA